MTTSSISPPARLSGLGMRGLRPSPRRSRRNPPAATHPRHPAPRRCPRSPLPRAPQRPCLPLRQSQPPASTRGDSSACFSLRGRRVLLRDRTRVLRLLVDWLRGRRRRDQLVVDPPAPLGDPGGLADPATQVVQLGSAHVAAGGDLQFLDLGRVQRERPLDSDAERLLTDGERLAGAGALPLEDDPLEYLGAAAAALDDLEVDAQAIARREGRKSLPLLATLDAVDYGAHLARKSRRTRMRVPRGRGIVPTRDLFRTARLARGSARPATRAPAHDHRRPGRRAPPSLDTRAGGCSADTPAPPPTHD